MYCRRWCTNISGRISIVDDGSGFMAQVHQHEQITYTGSFHIFFGRYIYIYFLISFDFLIFPVNPPSIISTRLIKQWRIPHLSRTEEIGLALPTRNPLLPSKKEKTQNRIGLTSLPCLLISGSEQELIERLVVESNAPFLSTCCTARCSVNICAWNRLRDVLC